MNLLKKELEVPFSMSLPSLALPASKKTDKLYRRVMDTLEHIGSRQYIENQKYVDMKRMVEGRPSVKELREVLPFLQNFKFADVDSYVPKYIHHYDLFGQIINASTETYMITRDDFFVHTTDPFSTNEFLRTRKNLMNSYLRQRFSIELDETLRSMGLETDLSLVQFNSEEEMIEYQDLIARTSQEVTPESIDKYMTQDYKLAATRWATHTLERDFIRLREEEMIRENLSEYLMSGKCFRHLRVGYDTYGTEVWSITEEFHSQEGRRRDPHRTEYIGRITFLTGSEVISRFGYRIPSKLIEKINGFSSGGIQEHNVLPPYLSEEWSSKTLPKKMPTCDFEERQYVQNLESMTGNPMTNIIGLDDCGELTSMKGFSSKPFISNPTIPLFDYARFASGNEIRNDVYQVTEAYFTDYERVGLLCLENVYGSLILEHVTEDILNDFLDELGIKQIKSKSLDEFERNLEPNSILWFYRPYSRYGVKINLGFKGKDGKDDFYFTEKTPYQLGLQDSTFETVHPVIGKCGDGMGDKLMVYQSNFNVAMNQLHDIAEKELGVFFLFDKSFLMSDDQDVGDSNEAMELQVNLMKALGFLGVDTSSSTFQEAVTAGQFHPIDVTRTKEMMSRIQTASFYQQQAYNLIGVRVGQGAPADAYKTAQKDRSDREAMYSQLEHYYAPFTDFLAQVYTYQLAVGQYCQKTNKDISTSYSLSDGDNVWLEFTDENFSLRKFGVSVTSNAKERHKKELAKQYLLSTNTLIDDPTAFLEIIGDDTLGAMVDAANRSLQRRQEQQQIGQQNALQQIEAQKQAEQESIYLDWYLEEQSKDKDRQLKYAIANAPNASMSSMASNVNAGIQSARNNMNFTLGQARLNAEKDIKSAQLNNKKTEFQRKMELEERQEDRRERELQVRENNRRSREFVAAVNKN